MAVSTNEFYLSELRPVVSQGDIYLAPTVVVWSAETRPAAPLIPTTPERAGETVHAPAWVRRPTSTLPVPDVTLATTWTPVLVISHDCEIDKEFNEYVDARIREGGSGEEAEREASTRRDLDRYIVVSPLLTYDEQVIPRSRWEGIRSGKKIGYFPLPPLSTFGGVEFAVHLARLSTVERALLARDYKAASLSEYARSLLRFKVAEAFASRSQSLVSAIEAAVGHQIEDVRTLKVKRQDATVALVLDDGSELHVGARADREVDLPERTRLPDAG
jgi:hypothetical protein